jgi:hypothetical protein
MFGHQKSKRYLRAIERKSKREQCEERYFFETAEKALFIKKKHKCCLEKALFR